MSFTRIFLGVFVVYMVHTAWVLYGFLNTRPCDRAKGEQCIASYLAERPKLQLSVFTCLVPDDSQLHLILRVDPFHPYSSFEKQVIVSLPEETRANGSLHAVVYVHKAGVSPLEDNREVHAAASLTTYEGSSRSDALVSHWKPHLSITVLSTDFTFNKAGLPSDLRRHMRGTSLQSFRFWIHLQDLVFSLRQFGFTEENIEELICEFLALKNDITSWRKKKSMVGVSRRSVVWRCLGTLLVFLHLLQDTSLLVLLPVGLGACVEVCKVFKVFKIHVHLKSFRSIIHVGKLDEAERKTAEYDSQASRYLSYLVYPLCVSGAVFSLVYLRYKR
ncbi:hypothetical protein CRUP_010775 [Coryphaenoides rupestris]|nr:hypothetical protein CRUP_010775 [Coryphaenoides rupestris]